MRFTSIIAVVGITAGVASLIVANAISTGFSDEMKSKVLSNTSHITIYGEGKTSISNWQIVKGKVEKIENVESFEPTTYESSVVSTENDSSYAVLRVEKSVTSALTDDLNVGQIQVSLGKELAKKLKLKVDDEAKLITLENEGTPNTSTVYIKDIIETGLFEYDSTWIFVDEANYLKVKRIK